MNEFTQRANESIENMAKQPHKPGETVRVFVPVPHGMDIGDCHREINLDNASISLVEDGKARDRDGKVLFDAVENGADLYLITGEMRK